MWERDTSGMCTDMNIDTVNITGISSSISVITITGLEENSIFTITVTATSETGNAINVSVHSMTTEAGEVLNNIKDIRGISLFPSQFHLKLLRLSVHLT